MQLHQKVISLTEKNKKLSEQVLSMKNKNETSQRAVSQEDIRSMETVEEQPAQDL